MNSIIEKLGTEAAENEPLPSGEAPNITLGKKESKPEGGEAFFFEAENMAAALVAMVAALWRNLWGEGEGRELTEREREGFVSLFQRGARHFGLAVNVSGTKGFIFELAGRLLVAVAPRLMNADAVAHLKKAMQAKETVEHAGDESEQPKSNGASGGGVAPGVIGHIIGEKG